MQIELSAEQETLLQRAGKSGISAEELLGRAFAAIEEELDHEDWMRENREAIAAHIAKGCEEARRGEFYTPEEAMKILRERHAKRHVA